VPCSLLILLLWAQILLGNLATVGIVAGVALPVLLVPIQDTMGGDLVLSLGGRVGELAPKKNFHRPPILRNLGGRIVF
jgi:hypothetical protein